MSSDVSPVCYASGARPALHRGGTHPDANISAVDSQFLNVDSHFLIQELDEEDILAQQNAERVPQMGFLEALQDCSRNVSIQGTRRPPAPPDAAC
jgi:hypothetical protein